MYIGVCLLVSCVQNSSEYKQLKSENDSLKVENAQITAEMNEALSILNDIETDFQSIREAEHYLSVQQQSGKELTPNTRRQIKDNMQLISETLKKNKEQIGELEARLNKSNIQSAAFKKTIDRLTSELDRKVTMIVALQDDLASKNIRIQEMDREIASLTENVEDLTITADAQAETLRKQDRELNTAYYCFGTAKELKAQKILTGGGLFAKPKALQGDFNRDYFITIDIRDVTEIALFDAKAKLWSSHPAGSYKWMQDEDKNMIFQITDIKAFWSLSKYLVIEVG
ncbi:MAG: hypothetical protein MdMp024_1641 [Bacteroidales bacterium]